MPFSENELAKNAKGGTELMRDGLIKNVDPSLLDKVYIIQSRVRDLATDKPNILWLHDLMNDPESQNLKDPNYRAKFDKFVFVSDWQMQGYNWFLGVPYSQSIVLPNAIEKFDTNEILQKRKENISRKEIKLIYHTTPHRGLEILIPVFKHIVEHFKKEHPEFKITLDVYSSFSIYGWSERDKPYEKLFEECKNHPNINYHGAVSNEEIRNILPDMDIFAYPSIWPETSCLAAIEALSAGCLVLCPNYAALPETTAKYALMYQWNEDINVHAKIFMDHLSKVIFDLILKKEIDYNFYFNFIEEQIKYFENNYSWKVRARDWEEMLNNVINDYSRKTKYLTVNTGSGTV